MKWVIVVFVMMLADDALAQPLELDTSSCPNAMLFSDCARMVSDKVKQQATLVIRNKEKKVMLIRGINSFEQCQSIMGGLNTSPDIEFAECFR